jgi:hypothetical protein
VAHLQASDAGLVLGVDNAVIAGGGVAGLAALIGPRQLAGDRVRPTLLAPSDEFLLRALSVQEPFAGGWQRDGTSARR